MRVLYFCFHGTVCWRDVCVVYAVSEVCLMQSRCKLRGCVMPWFLMWRRKAVQAEAGARLRDRVNGRPRRGIGAFFNAPSAALK